MTNKKTSGAAKAIKPIGNSARQEVKRDKSDKVTAVVNTLSPPPKPPSKSGGGQKK